MATRNVRVAIVDDDASFRRALRRLLTASGLDVETFATGEGFSTRSQSNRPDCLLLDLQMPGLTGLEVQKELERRGMALPTIVITAHDNSKIPGDCLAAGAVAYFYKPVERAQLLEAIALSVRRGAADS